VVVLEMGGLMDYLPSWPQTVIHLISASQVARIIDVSYGTWLIVNIFTNVIPWSSVRAYRMSAWICDALLSGSDKWYCVCVWCYWNLNSGARQVLYHLSYTHTPGLKLLIFLPNLSSAGITDICHHAQQWCPFLRSILSLVQSQDLEPRFQKEISQRGESLSPRQGKSHNCCAQNCTGCPQMHRFNKLGNLWSAFPIIWPDIDSKGTSPASPTLSPPKVNSCPFVDRRTAFCLRRKSVTHHLCLSLGTQGRNLCPPKGTAEKNPSLSFPQVKPISLRRLAVVCTS
jgi:hypothetical protein